MKGTAELRRLHRALKLAILADRQSLDLTQSEASQTVGRHQCAVSRWESLQTDDEPPLDYILALAALGGRQAIGALAAAAGGRLVLDEPPIPDAMRGTTWEGAYREATALFASMFQAYTAALSDDRIDRIEHLSCAEQCERLAEAMRAMAVFHRAASDHGSPTRPNDNTPKQRRGRRCTCSITVRGRPR